MTWSGLADNFLIKQPEAAWRSGVCKAVFRGHFPKSGDRHMLATFHFSGRNDMANDVSPISAAHMMPVHSSAKTPVLTEGRRDFFTYRDLGVKDGSAGKMRAQLMKAKEGMTEPTGWHYHTCESQFVYCLKGWVELEFEGAPTVRMEAGDSMFIPGGCVHNELRTSNDVEILEVSTPGELGTVPVDAPRH
jgi:quercetin dioxygenase-like cupin family protein